MDGSSGLNSIYGINVIVAVGSVDGLAGAAACVRNARDTDVQLVFTQAFQVNTIDISKWPPESNVGFIDLGVNNEGPTPNRQLTVDFVKRIYEMGHKISFIADEHGKTAWKDVLEECGHSKEELSIRPKNRGEKYGSSCAILMKAFGESVDAHTKALLRDGNQGDQMNFDTPFGRIFNNAIKSNMSDPTRRPYIVRCMAQQEIPDVKIQGWMDEYAEMEVNLPLILASREDIGNEISVYNGSIGRHDATAVFRDAYKMSSIVVLNGTNVFLGGRLQMGISIATNRKDLNVLEIIQKAGITSGGMAAKANFAMEDKELAIDVIRAAAAHL